MYKNCAVHFINDGKIKVTIVYKGKETSFKLEPDEKVSGLSYFVKIIYPELDLNSHFLVYNKRVIPLYKENLKLCDLCMENNEMKIIIIEKGSKLSGLNKTKINSLSKKQLFKMKNPLKSKENNSKNNNIIIDIKDSEIENTDGQKKNNNDQEVLFINNFQQDFKNIIADNLANVSKDIICKCCHRFIIKYFCRKCNEFICENCKNVLHKKHSFVKINTKNSKKNIKEYGLLIKKDVNTEINKFNFFEIMCNNNDLDNKNNNIYPLFKEKILSNISDIEKYYENFMNNSGYQKRYIEVKSIVNNINKNIVDQERKINEEIINNENDDFNYTKKYFEKFKINETFLNAIKIKINSYKEDENVVNKIKKIFNKINELLNEIKALLKNYVPNNSRGIGNNKKLKLKLNDEKEEAKHIKLPSVFALQTLQSLHKVGTVENLGTISLSTHIKKKMSSVKSDDNFQKLLNNNLDNIDTNTEELILEKTEANDKEIKKEVNKEVNGKIKEEDITNENGMEKEGKLKITEWNKSKMMILKKTKSNGNDNKIKEKSKQNKIQIKEKLNLSQEELNSKSRIIILHDENKENNNI